MCVCTISFFMGYCTQSIKVTHVSPLHLSQWDMCVLCATELKKASNKRSRMIGLSVRGFIVPLGLVSLPLHTQKDNFFNLKIDAIWSRLTMFLFSYLLWIFLWVENVKRHH